MIKSILLLLAILCIVNPLTAQKEKFTIHASGIKQRSPQTSKAQKENKTTPLRSNYSTVEQKKELAAIQLDRNNMPAKVKERININKLQGRELLDGIMKVFNVEIKACSTEIAGKDLLSFLKNKKGFIGFQFVSSGLVKIFVEPIFDSPELKAAMETQGISFNFLSRSYLLKN